MNYHDYKECIEACLACAAACTHCASACLQEDDVAMMARCIKTDMECAELCFTAARLMSMNSSQVLPVCTICADACDACAEECEKHEHDHCKACAEACRKCAELCRSMHP